jgi:RNA-directed DNA polymerase
LLPVALKERGLELSHEKTRITHVEDGFDFLGQNVRRYRCGKVLTKPSASNVKTFLTKIRETIDRSGSQTAGGMIQRLNQQIKGWAMYHRYAASKRTFNTLSSKIMRPFRDMEHCRQS